MYRIAFLLISTLAVACPAPAQSLTESPEAQGSFMREALSASLGSLVTVGMAAGIESVAFPSGFGAQAPVLAAVSTAGSTYGLHLGANPRLDGKGLLYTAIGALTGAYVGSKVAGDIAHVPARAVVALVSFSAVQGTITALGSRIARNPLW